jgi:hypothetical protein
MPTPYTKEQIAQANSVNLIDYAAMNGYMLENSGAKALHVKRSGGLYLFKDSNRFYHHTTEKTGGPIDFLMQFEGKDFLQSCRASYQRTPEYRRLCTPSRYHEKGKRRTYPAGQSAERQARILVSLHRAGH